MKQIILFFAVRIPEENLVFTFLKPLKETINIIVNGEKTFERENPKKISSSLKYIILNIDL